MAIVLFKNSKSNSNNQSSGKKRYSKTKNKPSKSKNHEKQLSKTGKVKKIPLKMPLKRAPRNILQ
jgi:hypothetical protein